jgi:hypothetical protein
MNSGTALCLPDYGYKRRTISMKQKIRTKPKPLTHLVQHNGILLSQNANLRSNQNHRRPWKPMVILVAGCSCLERTHALGGLQFVDNEVLCSHLAPSYSLLIDTFSGITRWPWMSGWVPWTRFFFRCSSASWTYAHEGHCFTSIQILWNCQTPTSP